MGGTSGLGIATGPVADGLLLENLWWGSVFWVNIPFADESVGGVSQPGRRRSGDLSALMPV